VTHVNEEIMTAAPALNRRTIALVGLMGSGKSSIGRRLAAALNMPFRDADTEVESSAGQTIPEIFASLGEAAFREGERKVIARLLDEPPHVLATGGGAFMNEETRALIQSKAISVWLKVDIDVLARRVGRKDNRPLLAGRDPKQVLTDLAAVRYPVYAQADITVETNDTPHKAAVEAVLAAIKQHIEKAAA
jgi:shikimate kinase